MLPDRASGGWVRQSTIRSPPNGALPRSARRSDRRLRVRPEVVVERQLAVDNVVLLPACRALGECELRLDDLLEHRIGRDILLDDIVVELELPLEDRVRRLKEADLVLGLQLDVVLRVAVDRLPH